MCRTAYTNYKLFCLKRVQNQPLRDGFVKSLYQKHFKKEKHEIRKKKKKQKEIKNKEVKERRFFLLKNVLDLNII